MTYDEDDRLVGIEVWTGGDQERQWAMGYTAINLETFVFGHVNAMPEEPS